MIHKLVSYVFANNKFASTLGLLTLCRSIRTMSYLSMLVPHYHVIRIAKKLCNLTMAGSAGCRIQVIKSSAGSTS